MTFDSITYIMSRLDRLDQKAETAKEISIAAEERLKRVESRVESIEHLLVFFSQVLRYSVPILGLILAGIAILNPTQAARLVMFIIEKVGS